MTKEIKTIPIDSLIRSIFILHSSLLHDVALREKFVRASPYHFYMELQFPCLDTRKLTWSDGVLLDSLERYCHECSVEDRLPLVEQEARFDEHFRQNPLTIIDPFVGVGAFAGSVSEGSGKIAKLAYGVEIVPSAAKTAK